MAWPEIRVESWNRFNAEVLEKHLTVTPSLMRSYIYRGQADASWNLEPSLTRLCRLRTLDRKRSIEVERRVLQTFQARAHLHLPSHLLPGAGLLGWWTVMQHYSAPTRILDWTHSPLVGLYFAVNARWEVDGAVWIFHRRRLTERSDQKYGEIPDMTLELEEEEDKWFRSEHLPPRILAFDRARLTERMVAQQGTFTICQDLLADHAAAIEEVLPATEQRESGETSIFRLKVIIRAALKPEILKRLHLMNVTAAALFPGIDGLGREIEELIRLV